ncbi:MAG: T9SS type A sorting domain-containing protein [Bacteroidetes bacterium]|nr:T9SS type A sorting domain-containing protein [Bacteroidota bacterium]
MKNFVHLLFGLLFTASTSAFAQDMIPNHSFEQWDGAPVNWVNPLLFAGINNIVQSTDAQSGDLSARFFTMWSDNTSEFVPATLNSLPAPVTEMHTTLNGWYKGVSVGDDVLAINILLYNDGSISGTGYFSTGETTSDWTTFSVPITYIGSTPTEAYIYIIVGSESGDAHEGTEYLVDNLTWDGASAIGDRQLVSELTATPNPATDHINLQFTLPGADQLTFELINRQGAVQKFSSPTHFTAGQHTHQFQTADLASGMYMIRAQGSKYGFVQKIMVR